MSYPSRALTVWLGLLTVFAGPALPRDTLPRPPSNCTRLTIGDVEYLKGVAYIPSHADTSVLRHFGFLRLEFVGRSPGSVKYSGIWPAMVPLDSLAAIATGLDYQLIEGRESEDPIYLDIEAGLQESLEGVATGPETLKVGQPYRRVIVRNLEGGEVEYYSGHAPTVTSRNPELDWGDAGDAARGNFFVTPIEGGPFHTKESLYVPDDPNLGLIHVIPVNEGRYRTPEAAVIPDDPGVGTFHVTPVNEGRYHTVEDVSTRDHPAVGTFHVVPDSQAQSLRPSDFGVLSKYSTFQTGQTFFVTPSGNQPRTMSMEEWRRLHTKP